MGVELDKIFQVVIGKSRVERIAVAKRARANIVAYGMKNGLSREKAEEVVMYYFRLFVAADGSVDQMERDLFNSTFDKNLSKVAFDKLIGPYDTSFLNKMTILTKKMPDKLQNDVITLGLAILGVDEQITNGESKVINSLIKEEQKRGFFGRKHFR